MTPEQLRAARALAKWSRTDLAKEARISAGTVKNIELAKRAGMRGATEFAIQEAFKRKGIIFTPNGGVEKGSAP